MKPRSYTLFVLLLAEAICGCASSATYRPRAMVVRSTLLFDRCPGYPTASDITLRSDWPSTSSGFTQPERLTYKEHFYDVQGRGTRVNDYVVRRVEVRRQGSLTR